jgi:CubicO group peptidase (beta-lactamase class C family)
MYVKFKNSMEKELDRCLERALADKVTPGAVVGFAQVGYKPFIRSYGYTENLTERYRVDNNTVFDLASLTKPLVTVVSILTLVAEKRINLQSTLTDLLPENEIPTDKKNITLWQLMAHCSGLPAHKNYYTQLLGIAIPERKTFLVNKILAEEIEYPTGTQHVYSDLGYMLLGVIIEQQTGKKLEEYYKDNVVNVIGLQEKLFFPPNGKYLSVKNCAATEVCPWSHTLLAGIVHDDNCRVLGGVAGHAGLFGTAEGVLGLCSFLGSIWQGIEHTEMFSRDLLREVMTRIGRSNWTCGFDTPSGNVSSSGRFFKYPSVGHLGFTGTSFWIDLVRGVSIVLLTNRVHLSRKNIQIRNLRPQIHDILMKSVV